MKAPWDVRLSVIWIDGDFVPALAPLFPLAMPLSRLCFLGLLALSGESVPTEDLPVSLAGLCATDGMPDVLLLLEVSSLVGSGVLSSTDSSTGRVVSRRRFFREIETGDEGGLESDSTASEEGLKRMELELQGTGLKYRIMPVRFGLGSDGSGGRTGLSSPRLSGDDSSSGIFNLFVGGSTPLSDAFRLPYVRSGRFFKVLGKGSTRLSVASAPEAVSPCSSLKAKSGSWYVIWRGKGWAYGGTFSFPGAIVVLLSRD